MITVRYQKPITVSGHRGERSVKWDEMSGLACGVNTIYRKHFTMQEPQVIAVQARDQWDMALLICGDDHALDSLMQRHAKALFHTLEHIVHNRTDATELVQETFIRVYRHQLDYNHDLRFSTWLYTIGVRLAISVLRWRSRRPEFVPIQEPEDENHTSTEPVLFDPAPTPSEQASIDAWTDALQSALARLPEHLRASLLLVSLDGCSQAEVASKFGCTVKAVETRVRRARHRLRQELESILNPWPLRFQVASQLPGQPNETII